jgi:hypothetical protein
VGSAKSQCEIEQTRFVNLSAADKMDKAGNKSKRYYCNDYWA